jgi:hypothetical protein
MNGQQSLLDDALWAAQNGQRSPGAQSTTPSLRDRATDYLQDTFPNTGWMQRQAPNFAGLLDFVPGVGNVMGAQEGGQQFDEGMAALQRGDMSSGAINSILGAAAVAGSMVPGAGGKVSKATKAASEGVKKLSESAKRAALTYSPEELATRYPETVTPSWAFDKKKEKYYLAKRLGPEALALNQAREQAKARIAAGDYAPMFDLSQRYYADPAQYPIAGNTLTDAMPKTQKTIDKYERQYNTPEARARLLTAFDAGSQYPMAKDWYATGQLEDAYRKELGDEAGRAAYRNDFAGGMAATTGGADPTSNLLMAHYGNFLRQKGEAMPNESAWYPFPIGGRYAAKNMDKYEKVLNEGRGLNAANDPKRFNFSANFMGHRDRATIDEQMMTGIDPRLQAPEGDSYGLAENLVQQLAKERGVPAANFQDVAWAGLKGSTGMPMMQHVNEMIARTAMVTGKSPEEVLRGFIRKTMPMYAIAPAAVGLGLLGGGAGEDGNEL